MSKMNNIILLICCLLFITACSTTSRISDDDPLYTGIKEVKIDDDVKSPGREEALEEMNGALAYAPNNSFFGSSFTRMPLPIGLWVYNSMNPDSVRGVKKWFYNTFSVIPRTISSASPATRAKVANNVLQNYGYFNSAISYDIITDKKNPRKQKISYNVHLGTPYTIADVQYRFPPLADSVIQASLADSYLHVDDQFSVANLQQEKSRISTLFHNNGYYYYRPNYVSFLADTVNVPGRVKLLVNQSDDIPSKANRQWKYGRISVFFRNGSVSTNRRGTNVYDDTIHRPRVDVAYQGKRLPVRIPVTMRNFKFWTGMNYSEDRVNRTLTELTNMNAFSALNFSFTPADTTDTCSVLNVRLDATMDKTFDTELEFNFTQKSNSQIGPDASLTFARRNAFRNGEKLSLTLRGSYYWQTRNRGGKASAMDTYEWGVDVGLSYPWAVFPNFLKKNFYHPTSTGFKASFSRRNIANAFRYNDMSLSVDYTFHSSKYITHTFSPLTVQMMDVREVSERLLDESDERFYALVRLFVNDMIVPSMQYTFTYDNSLDTKRRFVTNFIGTLKESGNIVSGIHALAGNGFLTRDKKLFGKEYSQYLRAQIEVRNKYRFTPKKCIATRVLLGAGLVYGNSLVLPLTDLFYSGGAYSIRAFPTRSLGPGCYPYTKHDFYFEHGGEFRFEVNAEYRFPLFGNLNGALFVDAGNVWKLKNSEDSEKGIHYFDDGTYMTDGVINGKNFLREIAVGTGFGFRYDMDMLVIRFDVGVALHSPQLTSKKGFYNIPNFFKNGLGLNFAVGYPF